MRAWHACRQDLWKGWLHKSLKLSVMPAGKTMTAAISLPSFCHPTRYPEALQACPPDTLHRHHPDSRHRVCESAAGARDDVPSCPSADRGCHCSLARSRIPEVGCCVLQVITETLPALLKLKAEGLVRFIGITGLPLKVFQTVLDRWAALSSTTVLCRGDDF